MLRLLRWFITAHFASDAGSPTVEERVQRISGLHENLGDITIEKIVTFDQGPVEMRLKSAVQGNALLKVNINRAEPYRIQGLQILLGG
jgi:hypothetical protein